MSKITNKQKSRHDYYKCRPIKPPPLSNEERLSKESDYIYRVVHQYIETALWSSNDGDHDDEPFDADHDFDDVSMNFLEKAIRDCKKFIEEAKELLGQTDLDASDIGHNFWLNRNGHGVGFWDKQLGLVGDKLSEIANKYDEVWLYLGDYNKVDCE
jgi:hypothetical protein